MHLDEPMQSGDLEFLHRSKMSVLSIDQPGCGACVLSASAKWTWDSSLSLRANLASEPLGIPTLVKLNDHRVRIIVAMNSHACVVGCSAHQRFDEILNKVLDADLFTSHQLSGL